LIISPTAFVFLNKNYQELPKIYQKLLLRENFRLIFDQFLIIFVEKKKMNEIHRIHVIYL